MEQYSQYLEEGNEFLANHESLLSSLILSKQNARNNVFSNEAPQEIPDGTQQPSQGISEYGSEQSA